MNKHKYVRFEKLGFVLFPMTDAVYHADMRFMTHGKDGTKDKIVSAGFVEFYEGELSCYGRSESLDIGSMRGDEEALKKQLGL